MTTPSQHAVPSPARVALIDGACRVAQPSEALPHLSRGGARARARSESEIVNREAEQCEE